MFCLLFGKHPSSKIIVVLVRVSIALIKGHDQKQLGGDGVSSYLSVSDFGQGKSGQAPGSRAKAQIIKEGLVTVLLLLTCSA